MFMLRKKVPSYSRTEEMSVRGSLVSDRHDLPAKNEEIGRFNIHGDMYILQYSE